MKKKIEKNLLNTIKKTFSILSKRQKKNLFLVQFCLIFTSIFETLSVLSFIPFMSAIITPEILDNNNFFSSLSIYLKVSNRDELIIVSSIIIIIVYVITTILSIFTIYVLNRYSSILTSEIKTKLYSNYINKDLSFHLENSNSSLMKKIEFDAEKVCGRIINPLLTISYKFIMVIFIFTGLCFYQPLIALIGFTMFSSIYLIVFFLLKNKFFNYGDNISKSREIAYKFIYSSLGSIKEILIYGKQKHFIDNVKIANDITAENTLKSKFFSESPRNFLELLLVLSVLIIFILVTIFSSIPSDIAITLSIFGIAGFKIIPSLQVIFNNLSLIKSGIPSINQIKYDLVIPKEELNNNYKIKNPIILNNKITIKKLKFKYENAENFIFSEFNMEISAFSTTGIVGPSGSGKSTLFNILMGLIKPLDGNLIVDGIKINENNIANWQNMIAYVPQDIFLIDGTICENIAFGCDENEINYNKIDEVINISNLNELIDELPKGIYTNIGERGIRLSGGQKQRINIARALYRDPKIIFFDEATSALDGISEKNITDSISLLKGKVTILIIAHRMTTIKNCNEIFLFDKGSITDSGNYQKMMKNNMFKEMAT